MKNISKIEIFEKHQIRKSYNEDTEIWLFSVIDIIQALEVSPDSRNYWKVLKSNLRKEGSQAVTNINQLKMVAEDGKMRLTDVADAETILRLVQSVPSKKAEPIKMWLAKAGYERMQEMVDPERALNRSREYWQKHGRSKKWIQQRMMGQETRNKLTDYWKDSGVQEGKEYAILTNIIHQEWSGLGVQDHKKLKNLGKSANVRDHMSEAELIFTALAELSTRQIAENMEAKGLNENKIPAKRGGKIAKDAKLALEARTGKKVVTDDNYLPPSKKKLK
jgi:DNA-damage-inducible protein D